MDEHPIEGLMTTAMESIQKMVEVNTIIGDPVKTHDGTVIIPVSKVGFGFAAGGSEFSPSQIYSDESRQQEMPFGGGSGGGVSITPVAFLVIGEKGMEMIHLDQHTHLYEKLIDAAPQLVEKMKKLMKDNEDGEESHKEEKKDKKEEKKSSSFHHYDI
ncbi:GerW family sporulation protein [Oceanobacillus kimchii]|uniref:Spore protein YtfJ n=1 Tax=Oceanobacillus kimchii TaxID=746691 RepID=A0ABQ5TL33_9BACI|nr:MULTISPECIES: GerW family sporulation protein [Oceanobacillus]MCT1575564.1 GerW family sporulation protein [Oceanobacillus kimchii]MCT2137195.1 GerW family sporulation protein [Oceanobacillus kimchii]OEH55378.1 sporulation protein YtfJ [Oceanobacillus sp. E9]GLO66857.1 putative spore protein YtfJ [Oceanobacillus kimchii]